MPKGGHARSGASECADVLYMFCKQIFLRVDLILAEKKVKEMWVFPKVVVPNNHGFSY